MTRIKLSEKPNIQGVSKKRNLFDLKYLKDGKVKLFFLLGGNLVLSYNSIEPNFNFLRPSEAKILSFKV